MPTPDDTVAIYGGEEQMGALRELVLDLFVWKKTETLVREHPDPWDQRFLRELFGRMKSNRGQRPPWKEERCSSYHEHDLWSPLCEGMEVVKEE